MPWHTPNSAPYPPRYRALLVPDSAEWISIVSGALIELAYKGNWEQVGSLTVEECAEAGSKILDSWLTQDRNMLVGQVIMAAWEVVPPNYLFCDGSQHLAADYPQLYAVLHPNYILELGPDASFRVPDLRGRVPRGVGNAFPIPEVIDAEEGGSTQKTIGVENLPPHQHSYFKPGINIDLEAPGAPDIFAGGAGVPDLTGSTGGGEPLDVLNPYFGLGFYILAKV
jgi:microcystin-dependent protein